MSALSLALRNLLRNRRRSMTTICAMVIGMVSILVFGGYARNINLGLETGFVRASGHLQVQNKDYFLFGSGSPEALGIPEYDRVIELLKNDEVLKPMLIAATPILSVGGIAGNFDKGTSRTVFATGVVVHEQNLLQQWNDYDFQFPIYTLPLTDTALDAAVIGTGVARVLQLCEPLDVPDCPKTAAQPTVDSGKETPDDIALLASEASADIEGRGVSGMPHVELLAASAHGVPNVATLAVVKAERQGLKEFDDVYVGMHLEAAQKLVYGSDSPQVTAIILQLRHTWQIPLVKARFKALMQTELTGKPLAILDFATLNPGYSQITNMFGAIFSFISLLIGIIVLFTVGNTMSMAVVERTVEIGTLRAMGLRRNGIRRLFLAEGGLLGICGAALGVLLAIIVAYVINHSGLTWTPPGNSEPVPLSVRVWGEVRMLLGASIGLIVVAVVSALIPAHRASRMEVVDALRHV